MTEFDFDDYDDYDTEPQEPRNGPKALRQALKAKADELKNIQAEFAKLKDRERARTVAGILSAKGINPKAATLVPADVGDDEDAVSKWVTDYEDVFRSSVTNTSGSQETGAADTSTVPPDDQAAITRMSQAAASGVAPDNKLQETISTLKNASPDDVLKMVEAARGGAS